MMFENDGDMALTVIFQFSKFNFIHVVVCASKFNFHFCAFYCSVLSIFYS